MGGPTCPSGLSAGLHEFLGIETRLGIEKPRSPPRDISSRGRISWKVARAREKRPFASSGSPIDRELAKQKRSEVSLSLSADENVEASGLLGQAGESRFNFRGFEITKFTGGLIPLTSANRVCR